MLRKILATLVVVPSIVGAQRLARLSVRVESSGNPVVQAQVTTGPELEVTTAIGVAHLELRAGRHVVAVRAIGFRPDSFTVNLAAGHDTIVRVELKPAVGRVVVDTFVMSTRGVHRIADEPTRVEVVGDQLADRIDARPQDLKGALTGIPGVRLQATSAATGAVGAQLQGLKPRYTLLLSDGLPLYGEGGTSLDLVQIPPADLRQVEVIKGPASALYGPNALGGVINLVSKRPGKARDFLVQGTSPIGSNALGWVSNKVSDRFGYTVALGAHLQNAHDGDHDKWLETPEVRRMEARPRFFFDSPGGGSTFLTVGATVEDRNGGFANATAPDNTSYDERAQTRRGDVGLTMKRPAGTTGVLQLSGSYNLNSTSHWFNGVEDDSRRSTGLAELSFNQTVTYNEFLIGVGLNADQARVKGPSASSARGTPVDYTFLTPAVFVQDEWSVVDQLLFALTVRGDFHSRYGPYASPMLSMLYKPTDEWSVRLSGARGFNAPTPFIEEFDPVGAHVVNGFASGDPKTIDAEVADHGAASLHGRIGLLDVDGSIFGTVVHHAVVAIPAAGGRYLFANSVNAHSTRGFELTGAFNVDPFSITALYTYTDSRERAAVTSAIEAAASYVPRHTGGVDVAWENAKGGTRLSAQSFFTSRQLLTDDPGLTVSKPYAVTGLLLSQRLGRRMELFANADNLTDVRQTKYAPVVLPARATDGRWTVTPWAPLEGRTLSVGARVHDWGK